MKILYYDCFAGISGDMNLGAMIDLGIEPDYLKAELGKLHISGYELKVYRDARKGISGTKAEVVIHRKPENMQKENHNQEHGHNTYGEIREMIQSSELDENVKSLSLEIFRILAEAEAKIHDRSPEEVHFHEVGAVDSIVDVVGAAICLYRLGPDAIYCSHVELGGGFVHCAHGIYPVPAPATAEIIRNIPVRLGTVDYEATTPTGAAILSAIVNQYTDRKDFRVLRTGYGVGSRDGEIPNLLRVFLCETSDIPVAGTVPSSIIECNIDDMNPEVYDYIIDLLFAAGAKDVYITPVIMKKSRPAVKLSVVCDPESDQGILEVMFKETSTIGLRKHRVEKTMLERKVNTIITRYGTVRIKSAFFQGKCIKSKPEYEDCIRIARERNIPISQVYREAELMIGNEEEHSGS
ncbi:MAG: nickel pincer cofactor biosynthesis protein LarC [Bacteroidales bacterium]|nr:nickel pincer cofactor biosynthesis protein LarC [Bacteroidales bacterium]